MSNCLYDTDFAAWTAEPKTAFPSACPWTFDDAMTGEPTEEVADGCRR